MKKILQGGKRFVFDPIRIIEFIIALLSLAGAVYLFTPLYEKSVARNGLSAFAEALSSQVVTTTWSALVIISPILILLGIYNRLPQLKSVGWFFLFLARTFQVSVTILTYGFLPITWIYPLTLGLVCLVLWANARVEALRRL